MKEAFRLNKSDLIQALKDADKSLALFFIYTGKEKPDYTIIEEKIKLILKELTIAMGNEQGVITKV
jgi:ribonuclease P protein component